MCAERRLSPVEPVRRLREAAGVDHAHKAPQQKRIDGAHGNILISDVIDGKYYIFLMNGASLSSPSCPAIDLERMGMTLSNWGFSS
jgi:hypothetical protein